MKKVLFTLLLSLISLFAFIGCTIEPSERVITETKIIEKYPDGSGSNGSGASGSGGSGSSTTLKTNIGKIYYSDGTYSRAYDSEKKPVGIVATINSNGLPNLVISLTEKNTTDEYNKANTVASAYTTNITGFEAGAWTAGSLDELFIMSSNIQYIQGGLRQLIEDGYTGRVNLIRDNLYLTKTTYTGMTGRNWYVNLLSGETGPCTGAIVRPLYRVTYN